MAETKADFIRRLAKRGDTDAEILRAAVKKFGYCNPSYIRTCARQRLIGNSKNDIAYMAKPGVRKRKNEHEARARFDRYWSDPQWRLARLAANRESYRRRADG